MRRVLPCLAVLTVALAGCGAGDSGGSAGGAGAAGGPLTAVAAVYPLAWLAEEIAPEAEIEFLGSGSAEAHALELTPGQREAIETAGVVLHMGDIGYQTQVEEAAGSADGEIVDVRDIAGEDRMLAAAEEEGALDPHVWFDPAIMADVAVRTGEAFAAADPDNADAYTSNAERVSGELLETKAEIAELLDEDCRFDTAIVSHAAYRYLLEPFGFSQDAVVGVTSGEAGASGNELSEIVAEIKDEGFEYVLAEPVEGRADAEAVARETGTEMLDIFPLDVVSAEQEQQGYPELVRSQAEAFATALGCS